MTDWENLANGDVTSASGGTDFLSLYMSRSTSARSVSPSQNNNNTQFTDLLFSPSPVKPSSAASQRSHHHHQNSSSIMNGGDPAFCNTDNLQQCIAFLNQEVTSIGLASLYEGGSPGVDVVRLTNCCYDLLHKHQGSKRLRQDMEDRLQRSGVDLEHQQLVSARLKSSLEVQQREVATMQEKERQIKNKNKLLNTKLKAEKEEVKRLQSVIQHRDAQYKHEIKKKEREQVSLKDRLHQLITDKTDRRIGIEIANNLQRPGGKRGKWATNTRQEEELYRGVISTYEEKQKQLMVENNDLRQSLTHLQKELVTMLNSPQEDLGSSRSDLLIQDVEEMSDEEIEDRPKSTTQLSDGVFQMPYDLVRDTIEQNLKEKCIKLRQYIKQIKMQQTKGSSQSTKRESNSSRRGSEVEKLTRQIERYRQIIEEQEALLQAQLDAASEPTSSGGILSESGLWEDQQQIDRDRQHLQQQQKHFEEERKAFTEAAIRLGKDRKGFEEEKASFMAQQFNSLTPFHNRTRQRPASASAATPASAARRSRVLPSTPSAYVKQLAPPPHSTPVQRRAASCTMPTPSTQELYRHLGLFDQHGWQDGGASGAGGTDEDGVTAARRAQHIDGVRLTLFKNHHHHASAAGGTNDEEGGGGGAE